MSGLNGSANRVAAMFSSATFDFYTQNTCNKYNRRITVYGAFGTSKINNPLCGEQQV